MMSIEKVKPTGDRVIVKLDSTTEQPQETRTASGLYVPNSKDHKFMGIYATIVACGQGKSLFNNTTGSIVNSPCEYSVGQKVILARKHGLQLAVDTLLIDTTEILAVVD